MKRLVIAAAFAAFGITAVVAQSDPIAARKAIMKENGAQAKIASDMVKGTEPFDLAKAHKALTTFADTDAKVKSLFPDSAKTGGDTAGPAAIWENKADLRRQARQVSAEAKETDATVKDLDSFKAAMATVGKNCGGCHNNYRKKAS